MESMAQMVLTVLLELTAQMVLTVRRGHKVQWGCKVN
jgi:hypothetical protein